MFWRDYWANRRTYADPSFGLDMLEPRVLLAHGPTEAAVTEVRHATDVLAVVAAAREGGATSESGRYMGDDLVRTARATSLRGEADDEGGSEAARGDSGESEGGGASQPPGGGTTDTPTGTPTSTPPDTTPVYDILALSATTMSAVSLLAPALPEVMPIAVQSPVLAGLGTMPDIFRLASGNTNAVVGDDTIPVASDAAGLLSVYDMPAVDIQSLMLAESSGGSAQTGEPVVGQMALSRPSVAEGDNVLLLASDVKAPAGDTVEKVSFFRESGCDAGLQRLADAYLGDGVLSAGLWTFPFSTEGLAPGNYTFYAVATGSDGRVGPESLVTLTVLDPATGNDAFALAQPLTGTSFTVKGANINASKEAGEPNLAGNMGGRSVWYVWTAVNGGKVTVDTAGSTFDTMVGVYTGNAVNAVSLVASNDDAKGNSMTSQVSFDAVKGATYRIAVEGYNGASGNVELHLNQVIDAANGSVASATPRSGRQAAPTGARRGAAREAGKQAAVVQTAAPQPTPPPAP